MRDKKTHEYFDRNTPKYPAGNLMFAADYMRRHARKTARLIDVGCGDGESLSMLKDKAGLSDLTGMDITMHYLAKAQERTGCNIVLGSILDGELVKARRGSWDFVVMKAVLHHLIEKNRASSYRAARTAIKNSLSLLGQDGRLFIYEPAHGPKFLMDLVFHVKKVFSHLSSNRIELTRKWLNIGQPVVSYYEPGQIEAMVKEAGGEIVESRVIDTKRLGYVIKRTGVGLVIKKGRRYDANR